LSSGRSTRATNSCSRRSVAASAAELAFSDGTGGSPSSAATLRRGRRHLAEQNDAPVESPNEYGSSSREVAVSSEHDRLGQWRRCRPPAIPP
jgi:hypothetical protein